MKKKNIGFKEIEKVWIPHNLNSKEKINKMNTYEIIIIIVIVAIIIINSI